MIDPRFFKPVKSLTLEEIAAITGAEIRYAGAHGKTVIHNISGIDATAEDTITFIDRKEIAAHLTATKATACVISPEFVKPDLPFQALLVTPTPKRAFAKIAHAFYPHGHITELKPAPHTQWPHVTIDPTATIDASVTIGSGTVIGPHVSIAKGVVIGENCVIHSHVSIGHAILGNRVTLHPGARIGQPGFGFIIEGETPVDFPQLGRTIIEDNVRIGANTCIDRGTIHDTFIGQGSRIDNLVQIAHNVRLGKGCVIVSQVGIAGSTEIGDYTILAGQVGMADNLKIGKNVKIAAQSGVMRNIEDNAVVCGTPAIPIVEYWRQSVILSKLTRGKK
jgi:UDP-3-O-[3-hydroxymyristoyl] glucosamine N-acyltransferase